jgi:hypothetical protein
MRVAPRRIAPLLGLVAAWAALPASSCGERDATPGAGEEIDAASGRRSPTADQPRRPDADAPAAPTCAFQPGDRVAFEILEGIPNPRCARALESQTVALSNATGERIGFDLGGGPVAVEPGTTWTVDHPVGEWLAPGVHRIAMPFYGGSGPELWVQDSSVVRFGGTVVQTFVSARGIVVEAGADSLSVALDAETRIFDGRGASVSPDRFSLVLAPGTLVEVIADMESTDTGTALEIRVASHDG